jgi:hypothetical protein
MEYSHGSFEARQIGIAASEWSHPFFQRNSIESVFKYQGRWLRYLSHSGSAAFGWWIVNDFMRRRVRP